MKRHQIRQTLGHEVATNTHLRKALAEQGPSVEDRLDDDDRETQAIIQKFKAGSPESPNLKQPSSQQPPADLLPANRTFQLSESHLQTEQRQDEVLDCPSGCVAFLQSEAQRRGFRRSSDTAGIAVEFSIEWSDELTEIPAPRFFISDLVFWKPLPDDDDPPEGGYIIGMRYDIPNSEGTPMQPESADGGWHYLIYLAPDSPSRQWIRTDWAAEADLVLQESLYSQVSTSQEDPTLGS